MRAAVVERYGEPPVVRELDEPKSDGTNLVEVTAAPLNPVDLSIATGKFYAGSPPTPYVPGGEGVGRPLQSGKPGPRVYFRAALADGSLAERALISRGQTVPIPDSVPDRVAGALGTPGIAGYLALARRAQFKAGETVLILGASGVLGTIAVQVARLLGAGRVIAGARDPRGLARAKDLGAHATVDLKEADGLTERIRDASGGPHDVCHRPRVGGPSPRALEALSAHRRLVQFV